MTKRQSPVFVAVCLIIAGVILVSTVFWSELGAVGAAQSCLPSMELSYDDGVMTDYIDTPCSPCSTFQGVKFSLPAGATSASISSVRFWCKPSRPGAKVEVWILQADHETDIVPHITYPVGGTGWQTVDLSDVTVTGDFYVFVRRLKSGTNVGHDYWNDSGRSFVGTHPSVLKDWGTGAVGKGDIMIRATVESSIDVGYGYPYTTIQEAVDDACPGLTIYVHPGTYNESVTVGKKLTIISTDGPAKTTVQSSDADKSVFSITAPDVTISNFTLRHVTDIGGSGVRLQNEGNCIISGNVILDNDFGIYVMEGSTNNILLENECKSNLNGVFVDGSENYISGNKLHGNTAPIGSAVFLTDIASGNRLIFNSVTLDGSVDASASAQVHNQNTGENLNAVDNWWGTADGPANAGGEGPSVGGRVLYEPWLTVAPLRVKTMASTIDEYDAKAETSVMVTKLGSGAPVVSTATFEENPTPGKFSPKMMGTWIDVQFSSANNLEESEIRVYYTTDELAGMKEKSLGFYWWNGTKWKACSKDGVNKGYDYVWLKVGPETKPSLTDLGGTYFAVGKSSSEGMSWWMIPLIIVVLVVLLVVFRLLWVLLVKGERGV